MPKINQEEYEVLKEIRRNGYEEIRRNGTGDIAVRVIGEKVTNHQYQTEHNDKFKFLEATGNYWSIVELIEEYERYEIGNIHVERKHPMFNCNRFNGFYNANLAIWDRLEESEETEVKTLESIREEIWEEMLRLEDKRKDQWADIRYQTLREVLQKLGHLDEPEVLSQEWVDEHTWNNHYIGRPFIYVDDLQNLLVPVQELPVIPKFVADYIDDRKEVGFPIYQAIRIVRENSRFEHSHLREWLWTNKGQETFVRAWLDGYTVEEEPLYRARLKVITDEFIASYLRTQSSDAEDRLKALEIGSKYIHEDYRHLSEFTEDELKRLDIWDSEQWEIEELE